MIAKIGLIVKIRFVPVLPAVFLHYHPLALQHSDEFDQLVVAQRNAHQGIRFFQCLAQFLIPVLVLQRECGFQSYPVLLLGNVLVGIKLLALGSAGCFGFLLVALSKSVQGPSFTRKGKGSEFIRRDAKGENFA